MPHEKKKLKSENFCFLDVGAPPSNLEGPPWKIFKEKNLTCENKTCPTIISEQLCQKTFFSHLLTFRDNGGPQFPAKMHQFWDFGPQGGPGEVWKPQKWTRHAWLPLFRPLTRLSTPKDGRTLHKGERPTFTQKIWLSLRLSEALWGSRSPFPTPTR